MTKHKTKIGLIVVVLMIGSWLFMRSSRPQPPPLRDVFHDIQAPMKPAEQTYIYVDIRGEVKRPGVYKMRHEDRLFQLIERAGGLTQEATTLSINQAQQLRDGEAYTILNKHTLPFEDNHPPTQSVPKRININTADEALLTTLPGIGAATAKNIVSYRAEHGPFASLEALLNVRNVGPSTLEAIREYLTH